MKQGQFGHQALVKWPPAGGNPSAFEWGAPVDQEKDDFYRYEQTRDRDRVAWVVIPPRYGNGRMGLIS